MKRGIPMAWHGLNRMVTGWLVLLIVTFASSSINAEPVNADTNPGPTLLVMGDSLSAAYGIERDEGWVNLLEERLGDDAQVINASISGETTSGARLALLVLLDLVAVEVHDRRVFEVVR